MKADDDHWILSLEAVQFIRDRLHVSIGEAQKILADAGPPGKCVISNVGRLDRDDDPPRHEVSLADLGPWLNKNYRAKPKSKGRGGAPAKVDFPALEEAFKKEIEKRGWPEPHLNDDDWRCQADVERWIIDVMKRGGVEISETTARTHARSLMATRGQ